MVALNKVLLIGNLTRNPELKTVGVGGANLCDFGLAINSKYKTKAGDMKEDSCFVDVQAWGSQAKICGAHLLRGSKVLVEGKLKLDQWEDKTSGQKRTKLSVTADRVQFLDWKNNTQENKEKPIPAAPFQAPTTQDPDAEFSDVPF